MNALAVRRLCKRYGPGCDSCFTSPPVDSNRCIDCGSIVALRNVSFDLPAGELVGIMGESGSGKSTLLRCLFFDDVPDDGSAVFRDGDVTCDLFTLNRAEARKLKNRSFSIVHQNPRLGLNFRTTAGGNVAERVLTAGHRNYRGIRATATRLLRRTRVPTDRIDELPGNFSGGMQQRVQIAKALSVHPAILFLDEVTSGLDLSVQAQILDLIQELHQQLRLSILLVTHDIGVVKLLASQTMIMQHGTIVESGLTDQILEDPQHPYTQELVGAAL
ncbi:MAG: ATP-binding cassette domain-containing protein [Planctomycetota bacterium]